MKRINLWTAAVRSMRGNAVIIPILLLSISTYFLCSGVSRSRQIAEERSRICRVTVSTGRTDISSETENLIGELPGILAYTPVIQTEKQLKDIKTDVTAYAIRQDYIDSKTHMSTDAWTVSAGDPELGSPAMLYAAVNRAFAETVKPSDSKVEDFIQEIVGSTYEFSDGKIVRVVAVINDNQEAPIVYLDYDGYCSVLASRGEIYETMIWADHVNEEAAEEAAAGLQRSGYTCETPLSMSREAREYVLKSRSRDLTDGIIIAFGGICVMAVQERQRRKIEAVTLGSFQRLGLSSRLFLWMSVCRRVMIMICAIVIGGAIYMMIGEI